MVELTAVEFDEEKLDEQLAQIKKGICEAVDAYGKELCEAKVNLRGLPIIYLFEEVWRRADSRTRKSLVDLVGGSIDSIDEKPLIESKKENT